MGILNSLFNSLFSSSSNKTESKANTLKFDAIRAMEAGDLSFAEKALTKAMEFNPSFEVKYHYAELLIATGDNDAALAILKELIKENPDNPLLYLKRLPLLLKNKMDPDLTLSEAKHLTDIITQDDPLEDRILASYYLSSAFFNKAEFDEALLHIRQTISMSESFPQARLLELQILEKLHRIDEFKTAVEKARHDFPEDEQIDLLEASYQLASKNNNLARKCYESALEKNPFCQDAILGLAKVEETEKQDYKAISILENAMNEIGKHKLFMDELVRLYEKVGDKDKLNDMIDQLRDFEEKMKVVDFDAELNNNPFFHI